MGPTLAKTFPNYQKKVLKDMRSYIPNAAANNVNITDDEVDAFNDLLQLTDYKFFMTNYYHENFILDDLDILQQSPLWVNKSFRDDFYQVRKHL